MTNSAFDKRRTIKSFFFVSEKKKTCYNNNIMGVQLLLLTILLGFACCKHDNHPVPTYFWKLHDNGTMVDRSHPEYDSFITSRPIINTISRNDASTIKLRVWPDTVKNGEKVIVKNPIVVYIVFLYVCLSVFLGNH